MSWEVHLDLDRCQGYANCVVAAPEVFDLNDETGQALLKQSHPGDDEREAVEEAVRQCPTEAISITE